jgi:hypothetical protein
MPDKLNRHKQPIIWALVISSIVLWVISVQNTKVPNLSFIPPLQHLGLLYWFGLFIVLLGFLLGNRAQKIVALVVLMVYFICTISIIFELPIMHDSAINTAYSPTSRGSFAQYGSSYLGMGIILTIIQAAFGSNSMQIAHFFPVGVGIVYLLILGLFYYSWRGILFSSFFSFCLFALFTFAFGETFYLRINASPQTIGYLCFLFSLSIVPLANKSIWLRVLLLLSITLMIVTHPVSPLLSIPALGASIFLVDRRDNIPVFHTAEFLILILVGYLAWTFFMGDWIVKQAVLVVLNALETEKIIPIVGSMAINLVQINNYVFLHRILLISLLGILAALYLITFRSKAWMFATAWGIALLPGFVILFSYKDFFDRIILFALIPCAIIFGEGSQRLISRFPKIQIIAGGLLIGLVLLSAYVSYFLIGAVDRITTDEVEAYKYISSINLPLKVYANGFNLPTPPNIKMIQTTRGIIDINQALAADVILITKQMENAAILNPRATIQTDDFINLVQQNYILLQKFGDVRIYMKPPNELGNP